jgi:hypothetical protein
MDAPSYNYSEEYGHEFSFYEGTQKHCTMPATAEIKITSEYCRNISLRDLYAMGMDDSFIQSHIRAATMAMVEGTEYKGPEVYYIVGTLPDHRILFWVGHEENARGLRHAMRRYIQKMADQVC